MGASRILSAKKHSGKLSKYSALLYASSAHISFPPPSFRDSVYCHKAGFLSRLEPLGCGWLFLIGCRVVCFAYLCVKGSESLLLFWNEETNHGDKFSCFMLIVFSMIDAQAKTVYSLLGVSFTPITSIMPQPQGPIMLRKPALYQRMLSRKGKWADQDIGLEGV